jgi:hypothetical protein
MIIKINGNSVGEVIKGNLTEAVQNTEWYREDSDINIFTNYEAVRSVCDDNAICWMDAVNRSVMETNEVTGSVYKFIQHRAGIIREGFSENRLGDNLEAVLDCILWFF